MNTAYLSYLDPVFSLVSFVVESARVRLPPTTASGMRGFPEGSTVRRKVGPGSRSSPADCPQGGMDPCRSARLLRDPCNTHLLVVWEQPLGPYEVCKWLKGNVAPTQRGGSRMQILAMAKVPGPGLDPSNQAPESVQFFL